MNELSGLVLNQNQVPEDVDNDTVALSLTQYYYQVLRLPNNYRRVQKIPALTGFSVCVTVADGQEADASFLWVLERRDFFGTWQELDSGVATQATASGDRVWFDVYFDDEIDMAGIDTDYLRIGIKKWAYVTDWHYSVPNPYIASYATDIDGETPLTDTSREFSFMFRLFGGTADEGTDFLGNTYRSMVSRSTADSLDTTTDETRDAIWISKPNPSRFAVESLYFDVRQGTQSVVIDSILIDPVTPDLFCNVYYGVGGSPGTDEESWEERIWTHVSAHKLRRRDTYALPHPITADWIQLEFSSLQPRSYSPGPYQRPIVYKKYPKWVLDYFLLQVPPAEFTARLVTVTQNAYQLAFQYYSEDLHQIPDVIGNLSPVQQAELDRFLQDRSDASDQVDAQTAAEIDAALKPYRDNPALRGIFRTILGDKVDASTAANYPTEQVLNTTTDTSIVSSINRDAVVDENRFPSMFFYVPCRHRYRLISATLPYDRAYFASLHQVAFMREHFAIGSDAPVYNESIGDSVNMERSDFYVSTDFDLTTYDTRAG